MKSFNTFCNQVLIIPPLLIIATVTNIIGGTFVYTTKYLLQFVDFLGREDWAKDEN